MAGFLSGLGNLGLGNLENMDIFAKEDKAPAKEEAAPSAQTAPAVLEQDLIFDKKLKCPVCDKEFTSKTMKTGKAKLIGTDFDLRPRHEGVDTVKYDVELCPNCGYAALSRYFDKIGQAQAKLVRENISKTVKLVPYTGEIYSYEHALERYKLALANAVVKRAKTSEKAYICLKTAWICRGYIEELSGMTHGHSDLSEEARAEATSADEISRKETMEALKQEEENSLENALAGFTEARMSENFPMCGMDETTMDYLLAQLNFHFAKYDDAAKLVANLLTNRNTKPVIKNKALELKESIIAAKKKA
ncbi:MAG: DUF2225 domain-containing protein [Lachnospiraceae bacterium]|nr:DUF2225 domain-containing protein [Lachnospiraceae bacterium]